MLLLLNKHNLSSRPSV